MTIHSSRKLEKCFAEIAFTRVFRDQTYWTNFTQISHQGFMLNFVCRIFLYVNKTQHERNVTLSLATSVKELITVTRKMQPVATKLGGIYMCVTFTGSNVECRLTSNSLLVYCIVSPRRSSSPVCNLLPCQVFFFFFVKLRANRSVSEDSVCHCEANYILIP